MSLFWNNAEKLLDAALSAAKTGRSSESMTVVIGAEGGIHLLANNDWPLERIAEDCGARMAYRVQRKEGRISVEGKSGGDRCYMETESAPSAASRLLRDEPRYLL